MEENNLRNVATNSLALLGDSVYSTYILAKILDKPTLKAAQLNDIAKEYICASGQAIASLILYDIFTEQERNVYIKGRNKKSVRSIKSATAAEYSKATGLECVYAYLYLSHQYDRLDELTTKIIKG